MIRTALLLVGDLLHLVALACSTRASLAAENLFLRKQPAFYVERKARPRRLNNGARIALVVLARLIDWRQFLVVVQPETLVRWHREGFRLFWRWKSRRSGRPQIPRDLQDLIADMAHANRTWGEERIAAELFLKLGIAVSPAFSAAVMVHVCPESRQRDAGLRLLRRGHGHIPARLRFSNPGDQYPSGSALEYHRTSDDRVDDAAVQKLRGRRGTVPVPDP